ncbi:MAG: ribbon-helix-helix protein, CopG family [Egibacteraceae bacterium]
MLSERTQVLLTPEQRERLERIASRRGVSVGSVIREAIDAYTAPRRRTRSQALEALFSLEAPVDDWEVMKGQIARGAAPTTDR